MTDQPRTTDSETSTPDENVHEGDALERAAQSIRRAKDAEADVAAHDDITTLDDRRAGEYSEDPAVSDPDD